MAKIFLKKYVSFLQIITNNEKFLIPIDTLHNFLLNHTSILNTDTCHYQENVVPLKKTNEKHKNLIKF